MIAIIKLSPVVVLAILMISGYDALIAAPLATIVAAVVAMCTEKKKFSYILDAAIANVREITIALFILMAAMQWQNHLCLQELEQQLSIWL